MGFAGTSSTNDVEGEQGPGQGHGESGDGGNAAGTSRERMECTRASEFCIGDTEGRSEGRRGGEPVCGSAPANHGDWLGLRLSPRVGDAGKP